MSINNDKACRNREKRKHHENKPKQNHALESKKFYFSLNYTFLFNIIIFHITCSILNNLKAFSSCYTFTLMSVQSD